jgi:GNAT superfamily N-acetyltransferase
MIGIRNARVPEDLEVIRDLWTEYLTRGNDELESRYGVRMPVQETVEADLASVGKYLPPDGRLILAWKGTAPAGIGCMKRLGPTTAELKRMYVRPALRGLGIGRAILERLRDACRDEGYTSVRLDSARFMTSAHALYRSVGFVEIPAYPETEIPEAYRQHWVFMERQVTTAWTPVR